MVSYRTTQSPAWWLFGAGLLAAALWGLPLIEGGPEHNFFGVFWYTMLAAGLFFWALPTEQICDGQSLIRRTRLLGLLALWQRTTPLAPFTRITLEQEPNLFRRDSVWVMVLGDGEDAPRFAFAQFPATPRGSGRAQALAADLARVTGLRLTDAGGSQ
ncbi:hypothetical protein [Chitinilyticum piscinae]|uniref:PH domain-containing protein n=1 Tax=Chitinilyticum piscinae TaxID=2866724 RepID=A0A8J7K9D8_9NEIS|nr:hypothetical protein [Chitinilyticum piscinae]MBE9607954.1 hypothetical protein [Chitinilyticum piscinae]